MHFYTLVGLLLLVGGCSGFFLASPNQRYVAISWPRKLIRTSSAVMLALSWVSLCQEMQALTASFVFTTAAILTLTSLPFVAALKPKEQEAK